MSRARMLGFSALVLTACRYDPLIEEFNDLPVADAKVIRMGEAVEQARDGSIAELTFPFTGEPVAVTLDGTGSRDPDGEIRAYRWLSGTRLPDASIPRPWTLDAGTPEPYLRQTPPNAASDWPGDEAQPVVELGAGTWAFTLWVMDDHGVWSSPDTIRFVVGNPAPAAGTDASAPRSLVQV